MNKCHVAKELSAYLDQQLPEGARKKVEEHLKTCSFCAGELSRLRQLSEKLKAWQAPELGPFFEAHVRESLARGETQRGEVKMKKKLFPILVPSGVLAGVLVFLLVGLLLKSGYYGKVITPPVTVTEKPRVTETGITPQPGVDKKHLVTEPAVSPQSGIAIPSLKTGAQYLGKEKSEGIWGTGHYESNYMTRAYDASIATESYSQMPGGPWGYTAYPDFNTEQYDRIYENDYLQAKDNPLSTFSIDVDTASYSNVRRFLYGNTLPPKDAVRIEEMVNYFTYDYPQPSDKEPFSVTTEIAGCPWNAQHQLVLIGLQGRKMEVKDLPPSNLVFLLDVSGSMQPENKLPLVKSAFRLLVNELRPQDKVAIVVYAGSSGLVLDSTSGDKKDLILQAIDKLEAGGSTAGGEGIKLAYETAKKNYIKDGNNRVILATDGDFNVGITSDGDLTRIIEEKRDEGIFLTVLGFGMGNYKDAKMEKLADKGNGNFAYVDNLLEAKKVFVKQLPATLFTIAKDVKIQVEFNPAKVKAYRLIGYENRMLKKEDFNDDKKDAGEIGAGHTVTVLYEIVPAGSGEDFAGTDPLKYQEVKVKPSDEMLTVKLRYKEPNEDVSKLITRTVTGKEKEAQASNNLNFASAVAEFGMLLRDSQYKGSSSYQSVLERAKLAKGDDADGYRAEFIRLAEMAQILTR